MEVRFADKSLALVETEQAARLALPPAVIIAARKKLQFLRAAVDERDLRNWQSLHFEKLSGDRKGQHSIRLNKSWRLVFSLESHGGPHVVTVLEIVDYH